VGIVSDLLNAQGRSSARESRRLTEALDKSLDAPISNPDISAVEAVDAAADALRRTSKAIVEEKTPRPAVPEDHPDAFGDGLEGPNFDDAEPSAVPDLRNDERFLPGASSDADSGGESVTDDGDKDQDQEQVQAQEQAQEQGEEQAHPGPGGDDPPAEPQKFDDTGGVDSTDPADAPSGDPAAADVTDPPASSTEAVTDPQIPIRHHDPSLLDDLDARVPGFAAPAAPPPAAPVHTPDPAPSSKATPPEEDPFGDLKADPEPSFAERAREAVGSAMASLRGDGGRSRAGWLLAGAAGVLAIVLIAIFSLSGGRGKAPEPAGTVAAPPAQTENPSATPTAAPLVPATVSASCVGDSDAVAPFAGEKSRAWVCGRANGLDGSVLNITFNKPVVVTEITVVPGFNYVAPDGRDEWDRHRQVTGVTWRMGSKMFPQTINPTRTGSTMKFPSVITQEMSMTITSSTRPAKGSGAGGIGKPSSDTSADVDGTTAVSSIVITGYPVDPGS
jgi:hypothetical protein